MKIITVKASFPSGKPGPTYTFRDEAEAIRFAESWKARGGTVVVDDYKIARIVAGDAKAKKLRPEPTGGRTSPVQQFRAKRPGRSHSHPQYGSYCR